MDNTDTKSSIDKISIFPEEARRMYTEVINNNLLDTPIREDAWTVRQVFHHLVDSHVNSYIRIKLALTEDNPTIKPYKEERWAELDDVEQVSIEVSLSILAGIHERISTVLDGLTEHQLQRTFIHPDVGTLTLTQYIHSFARHGPSHLHSVSKLM